MDWNAGTSWDKHCDIASRNCVWVRGGCIMSHRGSADHSQIDAEFSRTPSASASYLSSLLHPKPLRAIFNAGGHIFDYWW